MCDKSHSSERHVHYSGSIVKGELDRETSVVALPGDGCMREYNDPSKERGTFSYIRSFLKPPSFKKLILINRLPLKLLLYD